MPETVTGSDQSQGFSHCYKVGSVVNESPISTPGYFWASPNLSLLPTPLSLSFGSPTEVSISHSLFCSFLFVVALPNASQQQAMGLHRLVGLAWASLAALVVAEDLLFYNDLTYSEYTEATTVLGLTGMAVDPALLGTSLTDRSQLT